MSIEMMPGPRSDSYQATGSGDPQASVTQLLAREAGPIRRRGSASQGRALEMLGHAVEYLVDSRMFVLDEVTARSDAEAVQMLMRCSRAVFAECPEVISLQRRVRLWVVDRLAQPMATSGAG